MSNKLKNKLKKKGLENHTVEPNGQKLCCKNAFSWKTNYFFGCIGITCKYTFNSGKKNLEFIRKKNANNKTQEKS